MGMNDYRYALEFRDLLQGLVRAEVEKNRPRYQMATVTAIDRINRKCTVQFPGETGTAVVNMGSIQPSAINQIVRVEGLAGDRYIADVMGAPYEYTDDRISALEDNPIVTSNIATNGGFESGWDGWSTFWAGGSGTHSANIDTNPANAYSGNNSARVDLVGDNGNNQVLQKAVIPVVAGEVFFFSWREKKSGTGTFTTMGEVIAAPTDAGANFFGSGAIVVTISDSTPVAGTSYSIRSGFVTIPAGCLFARFHIRTGGSDTMNGSIWVDDVRISRYLLQAAPTDPVTFGGLVSAPNGFSVGSNEQSPQGIGWERLKWAMRSQGIGLIGGGVRTVTSTSIAWNARFLCIALGRDTDVAESGHFEINVPADSTVITGLGGASNQTVTGGQIPLPTSCALWYIPPWGAIQTSVDANFRITSWTATLNVPNGWILVALRSPDSGIVHWADGTRQDYWRAPTLLNSWVNYGSGWDTAGYKKDNGIVYIKGLVKSGADSVPIFVLPAGYRPIGDQIYSPDNNAVTSGAASAGTAHTHAIASVGSRVDVLASSGNVVQVTTVAANGYQSLSGISFPAGG